MYITAIKSKITLFAHVCVFMHLNRMQESLPSNTPHPYHIIFVHGQSQIDH